MIRILIADDSEVVRFSLKAMIALRKEEFVVVGEATDGEMAMELADSVAPNVILMDISMPKMDGIQATQAIAAKHPEIKIIGFSMHQENRQTREILNAGATEVSLKNIAPSELFEKISRVALLED